MLASKHSDRSAQLLATEEREENGISAYFAVLEQSKFDKLPYRDILTEVNEVSKAKFPTLA